MLVITFNCKSCSHDEYTPIKPGNLIYCNECGAVWAGNIVLQKEEVEDEVIMDDIDVNPSNGGHSIDEALAEINDGNIEENDNEDRT